MRLNFHISDIDKGEGGNVSTIVTKVVDSDSPGQGVKHYSDTKPGLSKP